MRIDGKKIIYSPTDLVTYFRSPFVSWINHYNLVCGEKNQIISVEDETSALLKRKGDEFERKILNKFKTETTIVEIPRDFDFAKSRALTIEAMKSGADIIYQPALSVGQFQGYADFLKKVKGKATKLGNYTYEVYDTKLARSPKPEYGIQLNCYNEMLFEILGCWPERWHIILGDESVVSFATSDFKFYYQKFRDSFLKFHANFDASDRPFPEPWEDLSDYEEYVEELFFKADHLSLVAGITASQIRKLEAQGISTRHEIAKASEKAKPAGMRLAVFNRLKDQAGLQLESEKSGTLSYRILPHEKGEHFGLARLPEKSEGDVMFDMEGNPLADGGHEYLFGVLHKEKGKWRYKDWRAEEQSSEKNAFCSFIEWIAKRYEQYPDMHIYHYASYEETAISKLSNKYSCKISEVDALLRNDVLVDLYKVVKEGVRVGSRSYSIKKLEPLYGFERKSEVSNAGDSVTHFHSYCDLKMSEPKLAERLLEEIVEYNKEDVESTLYLLEWLSEQKRKSKIKYAPSDFAKDEIEDAKDWETAGEDLVANQPKWIKSDEDRRVNQVIAGIVGYFHREDRPVWWAYYNREDTSPEELYADSDCLAVALIDKKTPSGTFISFDPDQPLKLKEGAQLCLHGARKPFSQFTVSKLDLQRGIAQIDSARLGNVGDEITLIPGGPLRTDRQKEILLEMAIDWKRNGPKALGSAIVDVLYRHPPRVKGQKLGHDLYTDKESPLNAARRIAENLENSCLSIQGPPGSGKTYTGAHIICHLLKNKKRVAVLAQGKKTVAHLLLTVSEHWKTLYPKERCPAILMADGDAGRASSKSALSYADNSTARKNHGRYQLVGGTHWVFAHPDMHGEPFDYLVIDEAGQFALGAAVACSFAAKNLILLGDQMQLEQVNTGAHPDESGLSILNYYMNGESTVPRSKGVFLEETWRMSPPICNFVSDLVYESRLRPNARTADHKLEIKGTKSGYIPPSGILFLEVDHDGNSSRSEEEADRIEKLIDDLRHIRVPEIEGGYRPFKNSPEDLIVIAPYNAQVELIRSKLPGTKVGSVDLFQGQEAWISVLSMCASGEDGLQRGLDFILSKNRMNVGLSRAKAVAVVVGSPRLLDIRPSKISTIPLLNFYAGLMITGSSNGSNGAT